MSDKTNYPARGMMSEDGKIYTNREGVVLRKDSVGSVCKEWHCRECVNKDGWCCHWNVIDGAYVPSDDERAACEMARKAIVMCSVRDDSECDGCYEFHNKLCHLRLFLAAHGDQTAWEVTK